MRRVSLGVLVILGLAPALARAEEPITKRFDYVGPIDFFATGAAMAIDGPDPDTSEVDTLVHPAIVEIEPLDLALGAELVDVQLYWGGSIPNDDCAGATIDDTVTFTPPGLPSGEVVAEVCYCSDAGAASYDIQLCRASVLDQIDQPVGSYALDDFDALIANQGTHNASFSLVLVFRSDILPARHVALYDGLLTLWNMGTTSSLVTLDSVLVDDPPRGDLTWYALEGDVAGFGNEGVSVVGQPGALALDLGDAINPIANPMNHTINTSNPPQADALGVDVDEFDISAALTSGDTSLDITYRGGSDKYWIAYNIVGVNIYAPIFADASSKTWVHEQDADQDGVVSAGDTVRYTIHVENSGNAPGTIDLDDPIPAEAASWALVDAGGGVDMSSADTLIVQGIALGPGEASDVIFDVVIAELPASTSMFNTANYLGSEGDAGSLVAAGVPIVVDQAGDSEGESGTSEGESGTSSEGGESGTSSEGGESGGASESDGAGTNDTQANDEVGESGESGGITSEDGCNCSTQGLSTQGLSTQGGAALGLLALLGLRRRRAA